MFKAHGGIVIAGKVGYTVACVVAAAVMFVSGWAHYIQGGVSGIARSNVLPPGPQTGAMNILLMGLESRTDYNGNTLSADLLAAMHAGSVYGVEHLGVGGQDTNTLILIHVFAGGQRAVGISIPRDDWVTFPKPYYGQSQGKIDQAYGLAWSQSLNETFGSKTLSHDQRYFLANEAGQAATIATVKQVTGQRIDHFAEVNLAGFFALAQVFHGINVCVKSWDGGKNLHDFNSGFNQKHAGYLHLIPAQALAFVRERDNLPQGDIDRTHRQQAVIDYVIWKLEHDGVLSDLGQLTTLLNVAKQYVITDSGWDITRFAGEMHALTGRNMTFATSPTITTDGHVGTQIVNLIDLTAVRQQARQLFSAPPSTGGKKHAFKPKPGKKAAPIPAPSTVTVDVYNGGSTPLLASHVSQALVAAGYKGGAVGEPSAQSQTVQSATQIFYGAGAGANATKLAHDFGATATPLSSLTAGHVEVLLGTTSTVVPAALAPAGSSASGTPGATSSATPSGGGAGSDTVTVKAHARYGIPCVY